MKILNSISRKTSKKVKNIKGQNSHNTMRYNKNRVVKILDAASIITRKIDNKEVIRLKLARAGNPFQRIGINENNFTIFKLLIMFLVMILHTLNREPLAMILHMLKKEPIWWVTICYGLGSYGAIEWIVAINIKRRHNAIESELETLISTTIEALEQGLILSDVFSVLVNKISKLNPLHGELVRVKIRFGANNMDANFESTLDEMQERIGMEQIYNYCLALKQYEMGGKAIKMLRKQLELLRSKGNFRQRRETQYKANMNSVTTVIVVACIVILIGVPMLVSVMENPIFSK